MTAGCTSGLVFTAGILIALPEAAQAQTGTPPSQPAPSVAAAPAEEAQAQEAETGIADIIVTAQRRSESLQDVPIAVTALTGDELSNAGASGTLDVASVTPGLILSLVRTSPAPYLRGVGTQSAGEGEEGSIATYVDGVYIAALSSVAFSFNNIERVEVLKGPQGTLFGRNATGGLLQIITRDPSFTPVVDVNIGYANYNTFSAGGYASAGLTDNVALDVAGYFTDQGKGWGRNISGVPGIDGTDVNERDEWAVRSKLLIRASDALTIRLAGDYNHRESDVGNSRIIFPGALGFGRTPFRGSRFDTQSNAIRDVEFYQWGLSGNVQLQLSPTFSLQSITAYRRSKNYGIFDQDATPLNVIFAPITGKTRTFQQELLLVGDLDKLNLTAGLFYYQARSGFEPLSLRSSVIPAQNLDRFGTMRTKSYAAFLQGTYAISDQTSLTAGLRYTRDEREIVGSDTSVAGHPSGPGVVLRTSATNAFGDERTYNKLTWRFALDHQINDDILLYGSVSRGFKSGIFNTTNPYQRPASPETLDAYEVGIKSDLLDRTVRLNLSGFYYDYKDIQLVRVVSGTTEIFNAATSRIYGGEIEATLAPPVPTGELLFRSSVSLLNGKYRSFPGAPITARLPQGGNSQVSGDASGNDTIRTPPVSLNLSADYSLPIGGDNTLGFNLTYYFNSGFFWEPDNRLEEPSYNLLNAQLRFSGPEDRLRITGFVRNITNERYFISVNQTTLGDQANAGAPRTYGITLAYKFGG